MEDYPEELRTPPPPLVSLLGCSHHHPTICTHLHSQQPPCNVLALPDLSKISVIFPSSPKHSSPTSPQSPLPPGGFSKRDWLQKHRTRVPAALAFLFPSDHVSGDPAQWLQLCNDLDNVKAVIRPWNVKLVLVAVQPSPSDDINEDQMIALRKRAEIDSKYIIVFSPDDTLELKHSLNRLGTLFSELAILYYREEGRRIKIRVEKKSFNSIELNIRYCFKVAVYAEFRRDWVEALRFYEEAYSSLREMIGTSTRLPPIQRLVEIKTVGEQLHFKMSTLLLHTGKITEAVTWFRQHIRSYEKLVGAPEVIYLHWEWISRQFLVFAELLERSSSTSQNMLSTVIGSVNRPLTEWEFRPAYYYQLAAHYLKKKQASLDLALSMLENDHEIDNSHESVAPSAYVGQFARLVEQGDAITMLPITDEEYTRYTLAEGKRFHDSYEIIALLKKSHESYSSLRAQRMSSICGLEIAKEYFSTGDFSNSKQLFDSIASLYRQEGWVTLLWEVLGFLRECSRKLGSAKNFVEYSLEMAALPVSAGSGIQPDGFKECGPAGPPSLPQRESIHREVLELVSKDSEVGAIGECNELKVTGENPLHLEIDLVSPLRIVLLASVAFHEQVIKPGMSSSITVSLLSQLPLPVEIDQIEIQFNQSECNFTIVNPEKTTSAMEVDSRQQNKRVEVSSSLSLVPNKWLRLTHVLKSEQSGKLECTSVIAKLGPHFTILCRAESPASMDGLPLWKFEDCMETYPTKDPALAFTGQKATQVEELEPQVELSLGASGPALVGEIFMVPVTISAKGHDVYNGELKINLVDVRGGGLFSPREMEPSAADSHHVELLGVAGSDLEDESCSTSDKINRIQQSFGLVAVPFLKNGDSWSCQLEIKWHREKPVMLYVSLGYFPHENESNAQKIHVHKSLEIEGKIAVTINHRFLMPFRRDPLLLSRMKQVSESDQITSIPINEKNVLIVSARNCTEVPLRVESLTIEREEDTADTSCSIRGGNHEMSSSFLVPGEEFRKVFTVIPKVNTSSLILGSVFLKWRRNSGNKEQNMSTAESSVLAQYKLPAVKVELPPVIISLECPPYAILGEPFTCHVKIQNQTHLLQEMKFSLADSQSFLLSGFHNGTTFVLPKSEYILCYKLVPLVSGTQQLPKITLTSARYSSGFQPSDAASSIFVFPSKPCFKVVDKEDKGIESVEAK